MSLKSKALVIAGLAAAMTDSIDKLIYDKTPGPRVDTSKPATLSLREWKKRRRKLKISKHSRKQNRK